MRIELNNDGKLVGTTRESYTDNYVCIKSHQLNNRRINKGDIVKLRWVWEPCDWWAEPDDMLGTCYYRDKFEQCFISLKEQRRLKLEKLQKINSRL
jgi:hypothetical protein